jgi:hypothetical protein
MGPLLATQPVGICVADALERIRAAPESHDPNGVSVTDNIHVVIILTDVDDAQRHADSRRVPPYRAGSRGLVLLWGALALHGCK